MRIAKLSLDAARITHPTYNIIAHQRPDHIGAAYKRGSSASVKIAAVLPQPNVKEYQSIARSPVNADLQSTVTVSASREHHATDIDKMQQTAMLNSLLRRAI